MKVDIIVPCYNEEQVLPLFLKEANRIINTLPEYEFQYIFVDDGSKDRTLQLLQEMAEQQKEVTYLSFSRNFGKEAAMFAGLKNAGGDYILVMDADLQHPPAMIPDMLQAMKEGYDCCAANRTRTGDPKLRTFFSRKFYRIANRISEVDMPDGAGDFRMMNRKMADAVVAMSEVQRFSKGIFSWVGFRTKWIDFENVERAAGSTKWNFFKLFGYAVDGITAFSTFPLKLASFLGVAVSGTAFLYLFWIIIKTLAFGKTVPGYASTIGILLFLGGVILLCLGILGEYIAKIYMEVKNRPVYIIRSSNLEDPKDDYR